MLHKDDSVKYHLSSAAAQSKYVDTDDWFSEKILPLNRFRYTWTTLIPCLFPSLNVKSSKLNMSNNHDHT